MGVCAATFTHGTISGSLHSAGRSACHFQRTLCPFDSRPIPQADASEVCRIWTAFGRRRRHGN